MSFLLHELKREEEKDGSVNIAIMQSRDKPGYCLRYYAVFGSLFRCKIFDKSSFDDPVINGIVHDINEAAIEISAHSDNIYFTVLDAKVHIQNALELSNLKQT